MLEGIQGNLSSNLSQTKSELPPIKIISKNEIGYNEQMDLNEDDEITLGELREYFSENNITEEERNKQMKIMLNSRLIQEIAQKKEEIKQREEVEKKAEEDSKNEPKEDESEETTEEKSESINTLAYKNAYKAYSQY